MGPYEYFENLTQSIAVARILLKRAHDSGFAIEGLCLYVSIIDGLLRLAIIYSKTQKSPNHTCPYEKKMIRQDDSEKTYLEKEIYKIALEEKIIDPKLYGELIEMYSFRNKTIHRFSISDIKYDEICEVCKKFESIYNKIFNIVALLEHGPKGIPKINSKELKIFKKHIIKKIG